MSRKMIEQQGKRTKNNSKDCITILAMKMKYMYLLTLEFAKADLLLGEFFKTAAGVSLESRKIRSRHRNEHNYTERISFLYNPFKRIDKATVLVPCKDTFEHHCLKRKAVKRIETALQDYSPINSMAKN